MSDTDTLSAFFNFDDPARQRASAQTLQNAQPIRGSKLPAPLRRPAADAILWSAKAFLTGPVSEILTSAWSQMRDFKDAINAPPDEIKQFTLQDHEIALSRNPACELMLNGAPSGLQFQFELKIALILAGAELRIQGGRIIGADLGALRGGGSFNLGRATIAERKTEAFRLPTRLTFTPGVPLRR